MLRNWEPKGNHGLPVCAILHRVLLETIMPPVFGKESVGKRILRGFTDRGVCFFGSKE